MNDVFSPSRFAKYAAYEIKGRAKTALLTFVATVASLLVPLVLPVLFGTSYTNNYTSPVSDYDPMWANLEQTFTFGIFIAAVLGGSLMWSCLVKKDDRISALTLPASSLEKYVCRWLIFVPIVLVAFILAFEAADVIRYIVVSVRFSASRNLHLFDTVHAIKSASALTVASLLLIQSLFVLGSTIWPKKAALKTIFALFIIITAITLYGSWLMRLLMNPDLSYGFANDESIETGLAIFLYVVAAISYVISYFRYREIEIIQRW